MSLPMLWALCRDYPSQAINGLALFLALAGGWLLLATRWREQRAGARVLDGGVGDPLDTEALAGYVQVERLNRFFYGFGGVSLGSALLLSWFSTTLPSLPLS